ncbi:MAG: cytochrome c biogenesis protein [Candidatus Omnitrophica bacterium]|nr:cytochrome c biogenesis protein [Candidatus Omnitrophota bacterium]
MNLHGSVLFASYGAFLLAVVTGVLFLVEEGRLKRKDSRILASRAIPLDLLDTVNFWAVLSGFLLFSLGIVKGFSLARQSWGGFWRWDPIEVASGMTWLAYAVVLVLRATVGLKGRRVVFMSVMSFLFVMFTFVGVHYLAGSKHVLF